MNALRIVNETQGPVDVRVGIYQQRAATGDPRAMMPADMLRMHTLGSAEVLGIDRSTLYAKLKQYEK